MEVRDEGERGLQVAFDGVELQLHRAEAFLDVVDFAADALLLGAEEVERDHFEELGALVKRPALAGDELLALDAGALAKLVDLIEDDLLRLEAQVFAGTGGNFSSGCASRKAPRWRLPLYVWNARTTGTRSPSTQLGRPAAAQ